MGRRQVEQIFKTLGGKLTRAQIRELLGWEDPRVTPSSARRQEVEGRKPNCSVRRITAPLG
jgi:hypothetical protein